MNPVNKLYRLHKAEEDRDEQHAEGRWRLWVDGKAILDRGWLHGPYEPPAAQPNAPARRDDVCPLLTLASSSSAVSTAPSTFVTTTRPPSSTLPTADPTTTRGHNPPGQPPGFTLPTPPHTSSVQVSDQDCKYPDHNGPETLPATDHTAISELSRRCSYVTVGLGPDCPPWKWSHKVPGAEYHAEISWVKGCQGPQLDLRSPTPELSCQQIMTDNFDHCQEHQGFGGSRQVGCLIYSAWLTAADFSDYYGTSAGGTTGDTGEDVSEDSGEPHAIPGNGWFPPGYDSNQDAPHQDDPNQHDASEDQPHGMPWGGGSEGWNHDYFD
ncbi:hypothetical protein BJX66DRAFT_290314 [Aspergillus keveii]|uniref:Uncharacterized protein n=1 Tax=Aspergillus keveii TaxID=714993 RepID=A0ABR4GP67_9EURO